VAAPRKWISEVKPTRYRRQDSMFIEPRTRGLTRFTILRYPEKEGKIGSRVISK